jgi:hypothetical protein
MQLTPRDKRMLQILGAVASLALVFFVFTSVLGGGGDEGEVAAPTGFTGVVPPTGATATPTPEATETLPPVVLAGARDPFSIPPELVAAAGSTGGGTSTPTSPPPGGTATLPTTTATSPTRSTSTFTSSPPPTFTGTPPTSPPTGTSSTQTSPGGGGDDGNGEPSNTITIGEHNLKLISVNAKQHRVEIRVDHSLWTVEEGGTFEQVYKLVKIQAAKCARFLYGDDSFDLCLKS